MKLVLSICLTAFLTFNSSHLKAFQLYCPGDVYVNCHAELWDLSIYGSAYYEVYGIYYDAGTPTVVYDLSSCNTGVIYRTWTVEDPYWNPVSCTQKIFVSGGYFGAQNIDWPYQELQLYGCNVSTHPNDLPYGYDKPRYDYVSCSHVGVSYDDKVFNFGPDCKKILRKWTLIDWCNYTPGSNYGGIWTYTQVIKVSSDEVPLLSCAKEVVVDAQDCEGGYVKLNDILVEGASCTGSYSIENNSLYADLPGANASGFYPIGKTRVEYVVEYACRKELVCHTDITVKDNKAAVPYCYSGLNVALMPVDTDQDGNIDDGMVEVWASDLNVGSYHPCGNGPLTFSFSSDVTDKSRVFTCEEVGANQVQMWVTDIKGNQSYCIVNLNIQNNAANIPDCEPDEAKKYVLSGKIFDEKMDELEQVQVTLKDREPVYKYETRLDSFYHYEIIDSFYNGANALVYIYDLTIQYEETVVDSTPFYNVIYLHSNQNGVYGTNNILLNRNYNITAYRPGDMNRVDAADLDLLEAYLDGQIEFTSPYSYLAADVNEDGRLDSKDLDVLTDLVSGDEDEWPNERQWVFYNMSEMARMSDHPLEDDLSRSVYIENIQDKSHHLDFMGILKGDLSKLEETGNAGAKGPDSAELRFSGQSQTAGKAITLFPNPFDEQLVLEVPTSAAGGELRIFDVAGRAIFSSDFRSGEKVIIPGTINWESGVYYYEWINEGEKNYGKIIKR